MSSPSSLPPDALYTAILEVLNKQGADVQNELLELVGYDNMDMLTSILLHRNEIVGGDHQADGTRSYHTSVAPSISVRTESQIREAKQRSKQRGEQVKGDTDSGSLFDRREELRLAHARRLTKKRSLSEGLKPARPLEPAYPHVYRSSPASNSLLGTVTIPGHLQSALPAGSVREEFKDHEEVTVPASKPAAPRNDERLVLLEEMDPLCQYTFRKYTSLNRIQSIIFPTAYGTNENILLSAPTGAGKTDVALLTILRTLSMYCSPSPSELDWSISRPTAAAPGQGGGHGKGSGMGNNGGGLAPPALMVAKSEFKIVYVAPMKALATEVVRKFASRLSWLGIQVRELTGDMQLTKAEIQNTQIIVTTPEKWDVVTRKSVGDTELVQKVRLIIVDEVHLLHDDRGSVIESIIARTQRQVESSQSMIRIVGLSATLPNYTDVAEFLGVNPRQGLFYFDSGYRPVPLEQHFVGIYGKATSPAFANNLNRVCYDRVARMVEEGHQVMVFVHARKDTVRTAQYLRTMALQEGLLEILDQRSHPQFELANREVQKSRNKELRELFQSGLAMHHAGMLRSDRLLVERLFDQGLVRVLCCTATLAWGVNLPAHAVIIKGTQVYDAQKGAFVDLSILDVLQIFGRAGRPQYESQGVGYIITAHDKLQHYISAITLQQPIESRFAQNLVDNLNAEITLGTVTNTDEAVAWLSYTYMYIRMRKNPLMYGIGREELADDPLLGQRRRELVVSAARELTRLQMIVFDEHVSGQMTPKDLGRIASWYYLRFDSVRVFNEMMRSTMTEADALAMLSVSKEFDNIRVRESEETELKKLLKDACCCDIKGGIDSAHGKTCVLLQTVISRARIEDFALVSDATYVHQNSGRIARALFEIALNRGWGPVTSVLLSLSKCIERQMWPFEHPLLQFPDIPSDLARKLEDKAETVTVEHMRDMTAPELGDLVRNRRYGPVLDRMARQFPMLALRAEAVPITRNVLRISLTIEADFEWSDRVHGTAQAFWIWVEDAECTEIYHWENIVVQKRRHHEPQVSSFTIPIYEPVPPQIFIRAVSDRWVGSETILPVSLQHLRLPDYQEVHTDLLDLDPLPVSALNNPVYEAICRKRFEYFNPVQTQIFYTLYNTAHNALVGAPTGSGKTVAAELALWQAFRDYPKSKVVYIAPLKALVKERVHDWNQRLMGPMGRSLVELTGDATPDLESIRRADIIITTPEKWDGISRGWKERDYVRMVSLVIIDEIHLLGGDRGPILEVIVSRMNYIASSDSKIRSKYPIRIVGLSTALANARDLADWLGIRSIGLYNFRHSVRPVPLEIYIDGFPGKHYCPRMATMNKPAYRAIKSHSPKKPVIIFVSSRRQTRLTAQDLIAYCGMEENPRHFLAIQEGQELEEVLGMVKDANLRLSLSFGIGLHHAGLTEPDRRLVERLFAERKIQVLVATSTLAWGVNLPAHLVILKGTEFFDAKIKGYVDYPITDVLQMIGRAGRPQFDDKAVARIFVQDTKKEFYKRFLHESFPVESSLHNHLDDHLNAEIAAGSITSAQDAMDYLSWTYLYRRLKKNPTYYGVDDDTNAAMDSYLSRLIVRCLKSLEMSSCIVVKYPTMLAAADTGEAKSKISKESGSQGGEDLLVEPTPLGKIASHYYLSHLTIRTFRARLDTPWLGQLSADDRFYALLRLMCDAAEWAEIPVRHNEDLINREMDHEVPYKVFGPLRLQPPPPVQESEGNGATVAAYEYDSPHAKTMLLIEKHIDRGILPSTDYVTDTRTVLDSSIRIMQAMVDTAAYSGPLLTTLSAMELVQCIKQAVWPGASPLYQLSGLTTLQISSLVDRDPTILCLGDLLALSDSQLFDWFKDGLVQQQASDGKISKLCGMVRALPSIDVEVRLDQQERPQQELGRPAVGATKYPANSASNALSPLLLRPQTRYMLTISLRYDRLGDAHRWQRFPKPEMLKEPGQAFTPRFGKVQYEGWWIVLGEEKADLVHGTKRLSRQGRPGEPQKHTLDCMLQFISPETPGDAELTLFVVSDSYLGLDQQVSIPIRVDAGDEKGGGKQQQQQPSAVRGVSHLPRDQP
ncbi:activating signal cointegrator 1 complex subunit 3 [Spiromyces aspiralis]|uniref:Activating signal cointegrator 1 complex subunit 3 n=1 Tax=Spiromyces aspiralis TaxID=68401 RepID=A0ACC1HIC6_9FUNG|nr:activating signal cointegrator 1 complex subunit 3 [Spiromyces aspiralis]